ncbi:hypothetical protein LSM04_007952 [Trypanosoma melophagium]|uniref:uncharacterized protein n=1 Tax=Trypanosoma melophagium TaxID=715481 RepID=UPI00351A31C8|nr:hypothetical protein LSM04_007952 [Trypanosoma melophagium]
MSTFFSEHHPIDTEDVRDAVLSIKEARRLCRMQLLSYNKGSSSSSSDATLSFIQRLCIPRSAHLDTVESLTEAVQLLQKERKWINMRCTILYDRLQQLYRYRGTVVNRPKEVYEEQPMNIESGTSISHPES